MSPPPSTVSLPWHLNAIVPSPRRRHGRSPLRCLEAYAGLCGSWAFLVGTPTLFEYSIHEEREENTTHYDMRESEDAPRLLVLVNGYFLLLVAYIIPLLAICINYGRLASFIIKRSPRCNPWGLCSCADSSTNIIPLKEEVGNYQDACHRGHFVCSFLWLPYFTLLIIAVSRYPCFKTLILL